MSAPSPQLQHQRRYLSILHSPMPNITPVIMLQEAEVSPAVEPSSPSTAVTTPEERLDHDDDIWASDSANDDLTHSNTARHELLSDLPTVKRQHMTDGYREGLAIGKAKVMQKGFDDGYPIGIQIALRVGQVLGVLEGYLAQKAISVESKSSLQKVYDTAKEELSCPALLKDINDEIIANTEAIPPHINAIVQKWEQLVLEAPAETRP